MTYPFQPILDANTIQLVAYNKTHDDGLKKSSMDDRIWTTNRPIDSSLDEYTSSYIHQMASGHMNGDPFAYTVILKEQDQIIGSTRYYGMSPQDQRLCIGFTWYHPSYWGSTVNSEVKFLLLTQAFEVLSVNRVEFHVDSRNRRSISAMFYLGASLECVMKKHKIVQGNYVRDTVLFSILTDDWPRIKSHLKKRMALS